MIRAAGIALAGLADAARVELAGYLRDGGFDVTECETPTVLAKFIGVVVIDDGNDVAADVRGRAATWTKHATPQRVVIVTTKPAQWRALLLAHPGRVHVLAAPAFGWQIIDALRASASGDM